MQTEPTDQFFTNLYIYNLIQEAQSDKSKLEDMHHGASWH